MLNFVRVLVFGLLVSFPLATTTVAATLSPQNLEQAIDLWKKQAQNYSYSAQKAPQEIDIRLKISQGLIGLGRFSAAIAQLNRVKVLLEPSEVALAALTDKRLGDAYAGAGNEERAVSFYERSMKRNNSSLALNNLVKALLNRRANLLLEASRVQRRGEILRYKTQAKQATIKAESYAKKAIELDDSSLARVEALVNWHKLPDRKLTAQQLEQGRRLVRTLPPSKATVFNILEWAKVDRQNQEMWLSFGRDLAYNLGDWATIGYASLALAEFWEKDLQLEQARQLTREAILAAQQTSDHNILFRAQRLLGRLNVARNEPRLALDAYRSAISSIDKLNTDVNLNSSIQIVKLNQEIEPIYRNTLELLINSDASQQELVEAIGITDKLRLAQLRRYFGDNCLSITRKQQLNQKKTVETPTIRSIILKERLVVLAELPDGRILQSETSIPQKELNQRVEQWSQDLVSGFNWSFRTNSKWFYQALIQPFEKELEAFQPKVIVFVHDGILRNVPMAALNDGEKFFAQKWASVSSLGLGYDNGDEGSNTSKLNSALALGLSHVPTEPDLATLEFVPEELENVKELFGGREILGKQFTVNNFATQVAQKQYPLVHLATHGYFGGTAETSYVYAYDRKIPVLKLDDIIRQSPNSAPQFLVLSACETALSSNLSLLGLAGLATRTGINTTLGSLWFVRDRQQSQIIQQFYQRVENQNQSKAVALQEIQQESIEKLAHPAEWASLTLIGDWQ